MDSKFNNKYPSKRKAEEDLRQKEENTERRRWEHNHVGRDCGLCQLASGEEMVTSNGLRKR